MTNENDDKNIEEMEEIVDSYVSDCIKPMFFLGIYDKSDTKEKHFTLNLCNSLNKVKRLIKHYKTNQKDKDYRLFLIEINLKGDYIPYLIFDSNVVTFNTFNPK